MMKNESFTLSIKEELVHLTNQTTSQKKALISSLIKSGATFLIRDNHYVLAFENRIAFIVKYIYSTFKELYDVEAHILFKLKNNKKVAYRVEIISNIENILQELELSLLDNKISKKVVNDDNTIGAYLAGLFLLYGSLNSPHTSNYHLELRFDNDVYCKWVMHLFGKLKNLVIEPRYTVRRGKSLIYFKKSDQIANFLLLIGAVNGCMEFENIRIDRDYTNSANRLMNLDTANMSKTLSAGKRQQKEIKYLIDKKGLSIIGNQKAQSVALKRLDNASFPLEEIASLVSEELNTTVSKSNVNHIFRKIHQIYERETDHRK